MIEVACIQGTAEWDAARCGSLGASSVHEAVARTKTGWGASRANCMARLIIERLTGRKQESFQSPAMRHGIETEPEARSYYAFVVGEVTEVGLVKHPTLEGTHASPDGLVGEDGLVEIKCPQAAAHLATLLGEAIPKQYLIQMQWQMACTGRAWCDFVSYCPDFPGTMQAFIQRVARDRKMIAELEGDVAEFLKETDRKRRELAAKYLGAPSTLMADLSASVALEGAA